MTINIFITSISLERGASKDAVFPENDKFNAARKNPYSIITSMLGHIMIAEVMMIIYLFQMQAWILTDRSTL